jgi:hypothetical protein
MVQFAGIAVAVHGMKLRVGAAITWTSKSIQFQL